MNETEKERWPKTESEVIETVNRVAARQRNTLTRNALNVVSEFYERGTSPEHTSLYTIVDGAKCSHCGGAILKYVGTKAIATPSGAPRIGCPVCRTVKASATRRSDIVYTALTGGDRQ